MDVLEGFAAIGLGLGLVSLGEDSLRRRLLWNRVVSESRAGSVTDVCVIFVWKEPPLATYVEVPVTH